MSRSRAWPSLVAAVVLLALGALVAVGVGQALGLSYEPADTPPAAVSAVDLDPMVPAPAIATIDVPAGEQVALAAAAVGDALTARGLPAPSVGVGTGDADLTVRLVPAFADSAEAYRVRDGRPAGRWRRRSRRVRPAGLYALADRIRSGARSARPTARPSSPASACGSSTRARWAARPTPPRSPPAPTTRSTPTSSPAPCCREAPWVDQAVVDEIDAQFRQLVQHALRQGYNGVVVPGFLEYVTFSGVGDGHEVYPEGDPHVARAEAMVEAFGPVFAVRRRTWACTSTC